MKGFFFFPSSVLVSFCFYFSFFYFPLLQSIFDLIKIFFMYFIVPNEVYTTRIGERKQSMCTFLLNMRLVTLSLFSRFFSFTARVPPLLIILFVLQVNELPTRSMWKMTRNESGFNEALTLDTMLAQGTTYQEERGREGGGWVDNGGTDRHHRLRINQGSRGGRKEKRKRGLTVYNRSSVTAGSQYHLNNQPSLLTSPPTLLASSSSPLLVPRQHRVLHVRHHILCHFCCMSSSLSLPPSYASLI